MSFDETVFITGFPGFIAGRLVQRLAAEGARLMLLVQPAFVERARQDIARIAVDEGVSARNLSIIQGDITAENLGMSVPELQAARTEATTIFHLAALYDLAVSRETGIKINLGGTRNVNTFARSLPNLRRYHYVSTCYVAGRRKGVILETELKHRQQVERPRIIQQITDARTHGDLSENAEYEAAKDKQGFIEGRILEIEGKLAAAQIIDPAIFKKSEPMYVDICTTPGPRYGDSMFWPKNWQEVPESEKHDASAADRRVFVNPRQFYLGPPPSAGLVNVLLEVDHDRFKNLFVDLMTKPIRRA
jgi:hypothetical protein